MIHIKNVDKQANNELLFQATKLNVNGGDIVGVLGDNGAGKSTLMKMIIGDDMDYTGSITADGLIEYVPQFNNDGRAESGGQQMKRSILEALKRQPDILILDEPTSNLDMANQEWLIQVLKHFNGTLILVSHDEFFLTAMANSLWVFNNQEVQQFQMGYQEYQKKIEHQFSDDLKKYNDSRRHAQKLRFEAQKKVQHGDRIKREHNSLKADSLQAKLHKQGNSMQMRADELSNVARPKVKKSLKLQHTMDVRAQTIVVRVVDEDVLSPDGRVLIREPQLVLRGNDKILLSGVNGVGKTMFIQHILNKLSLQQKTKVGYFDQKLDNLDEHATVLENVLSTSVENEQIARDFLGAMGIRREMIYQKVATLSGGQRVRTSLVKALLTQANLLILDEPTNFLDLSAINALHDFLVQYHGAVILVSHNQQFVSDLEFTNFVIENERLVEM